jgi:hypothetical protein
MRVRRVVRDESRPPQHDVLDEKPHSVYEIVTRQMLADLREDVAEVKGRVNALLWLLAGAIFVEFVSRLMR